MLLPMTLIPGGAKTLAVTTSADVRVALGGPSAATSQGVQQMRQYIVYSSTASANEAHIRFGDSTVQAVVTTDIPIAPGSYHAFTAAATYIGARCASDTATLWIAAGDGM